MRAFDELWALVEDLEALVRIALNKSGGTGTSVSGTGFWKSISGALQPAASIGQPGQIPATNQVGSDIVWQDVFGSWVTISGGTFIPDNSQKALLADTGGAQIFVHTPTAPYDGQDLIIYDYEGFAAVNPIVIVGSGSQKVEDPSNPGSDPIASGHMGMQGMTAWWKYFAGTQEWQLMLVSTPYQATPNSWAQASWFVDPLNGNDQNPGTASGSPLQTKAELARRFGGTWSPKLDNVAMVVTYLTPDTTDDDPALFAPTLGDSSSFTQIASLPAAGFTGTLGTVTAKNVAGNAALRSTFTVTTGAITAGMMLVNATRGNSRAFVQRNVSGGTWQISQPLAPFVTGSFPSPTNVDTWATGDAITGYALTNVNIPRVAGQVVDLDSPFTNGHYLRQLNVWDPDNVGLSPCNVDANVVPYFIECSANRLCTLAGSGQAAQATFMNFFTSALLFAQANTANGVLVAGGVLSGGFLGGGTIEHDTLIGAAFTASDSQFGEVFVDAAVTLTTQGNCSALNAAGIFFGAGTLNVASGVMGYSNESAVTTFPLSGGLALRGVATGYSNATSAGVVTVHKVALSAANLDAAAGATGFSGLAWSGAACFSANGAQP